MWKSHQIRIGILIHSDLNQILTISNLCFQLVYIIEREIMTRLAG